VVLTGEEIVSLKNKFQASDGRDALAKALYGRMFGWIVRQINSLLNPNNKKNQSVHSYPYSFSIAGWRRGSAVRTLVFNYQTFPDLRLIYG